MHAHKCTHANIFLVLERYSIYWGWPLRPPPSATAAVKRWCCAAQYGMWVLTMASVCGHHAVTASSPTRTPFCLNCCAVCLVVCVEDPAPPVAPEKGGGLHSVPCKHTTMQHTKGGCCRSGEGGMQTWGVILSLFLGWKNCVLGMTGENYEQRRKKNVKVSWTTV